MDMNKLELLSTEVLQKMRDKCQELLARRASTSLRVGRIGWFLDRNGDKRFIRVVRVNAKTVTGKEVDGITHLDLTTGRGMTWRVSPMLLNIVDTGTTPATAPKLNVAHRPTTSAATW